MNYSLKTYLQSSKENTSAAPLALFRILFGAIMAYSMVRFWYHGWIEKFYIEPSFWFSYYGFSWAKPLGEWTYLLFFICGVSSLFIMVGFKYRWSILAFFLSFTYIELMDKTTYLNHYYFISLVGFIMLYLPAASYFSVDAYRNKKKSAEFVPRWTIDSLKFMLGIVYFYAGLAKLQSDWMVDAVPLKIWLPGRYDLPILGPVLQQEWVAYAFSWGGAFYDLSIPFLLLWKPTRRIAFVLVVFFHVMTRAIFPIGMFPYIMILSTLIFFDASFHRTIIYRLAQWMKLDQTKIDTGRGLTTCWGAWSRSLLIVFFVVQLLLPFRFVLYPGKLFWTEQGFRFSWRVMLMEKAGSANFKVVDGVSRKRFFVDNSDFLTSQQEKMMSTQPDMILEYAHFLGEKFKRDGHKNVEIYVDSYAALNGKISKPFVDSSVNLMNIQDGWGHKEWILPFDTKDEKTEK